MKSTRDSVFLDGRPTASAGTAQFTVVNPTTEEPYGNYAIGTAEDVDRAVTSARRAMAAASWQRTEVEERCDLVLRLRDLLAQEAAELAELHARTLGTPVTTGRHLGGAAGLIDMFVDSARRSPWEFLRADPGGRTTLVTRQPVGVVAGILPWNTPIRSEVKKVVPAVLAGCAVVLKPSPEGAFTSFAFAELCTKAGFPPGIVNVVPGDGATGEALVRHPGVTKVAFTGSTATGSRIAAAASPAFKRLQLELGGKSAAIVLDDADIGRAAPILSRANWGNSGQMCVSLSRVLVSRSRRSELVDALVEHAQRQVVGDPRDAATTMGPLVNRTQRDRVLDYLQTGIDEGACLATGGAPAPTSERGWFVPPAVFADVQPTARIAQEEIFGPIVTVIGYDSLDEAVAIANDSPYGLHGAVYSTDEQRALDVARRIHSGSVAINEFYLAPSAPFGGVKQSGIGREHGPEGYDSFLEYVSYDIPAALATSLRAHGLRDG
ncbi:aldehyde dehydrogenase family protein [Nocardioides immobilis]|uniref:aldehyde dehydrogenase family protein n=1 Tax=Nocardioides immobilis TaxID=2049295 RepID=UPI0015FCD847|nr:aldehyde dehydrogenase family protein [Nocardioides immobilis]